MPRDTKVLSAPPPPEASLHDRARVEAAAEAVFLFRTPLFTVDVLVGKSAVRFSQKSRGLVKPFEKKPKIETKTDKEE